MRALILRCRPSGGNRSWLPSPASFSTGSGPTDDHEAAASERPGKKQDPPSTANPNNSPLRLAIKQHRRELDRTMQWYQRADDQKSLDKTNVQAEQAQQKGMGQISLVRELEGLLKSSPDLVRLRAINQAGNVDPAEVRGLIDTPDYRRAKELRDQLESPEDTLQRLMTQPDVERMWGQAEKELLKEKAREMGVDLKQVEEDTGLDLESLMGEQPSEEGGYQPGMEQYTGTPDQRGRLPLTERDFRLGQEVDLESQESFRQEYSRLKELEESDKLTTVQKAKVQLTMARMRSTGILSPGHSAKGQEINWFERRLPYIQTPLDNPRGMGKKCGGKRQGRGMAKGSCPLLDLRELHHANLPLLQMFLTSTGTVVKRRHTGLCDVCQRKVAKCVKRARDLNFIPSSGSYSLQLMTVPEEEPQYSRENQLPSSEYGDSMSLPIPIPGLPPSAGGPPIMVPDTIAKMTPAQRKRTPGPFPSLQFPKEEEKKHIRAQY